MNIVILEGKGEKSELQFWMKLKEKLFDDSVEIVNSGGNMKIPAVLESTIQKCIVKYKSSGEKSNVLVCYDTTALNRATELLADKLQDVEDKFSRDIGVCIQLDVLDFYCFEDCLMLFESLLNWLYSNNRLQYIDAELMMAYRDYIMLETNSDGQCWKEYKSLSDWVYKNIESHNGTYKDVSREKVAYKLLVDITEDTYFKTGKKTLGICWFRSCLTRDCELCMLSTNKNRDGKSMPPQAAKKLLMERECGLFRIPYLSSEDKARILSKSIVLNVLHKYKWLFK